MTSWIHATGVHKGFGRGARRVEVLRGVDLDVEPGEFVTVVGSSGAGKSTLLYCLCGLIPADDGQISLVGNDIRTASRSQLARIRRDHVGFIFQDLNLISSLTVRDNVVLPARMAGRRPRRRDVNQVLDAVGLASRPASTRPICREDSASGSPSRDPCCTNPNCCSPTSPPAHSTSRPATRCWSCYEPR